MAKKKLPAFQFYPGDWRKDPGVQSLDYFERGVWIELLCLMHESERPGYLILGGKPYPEDRLSRLLGLSLEVMGKVISTLITLNVARVDAESGAIFSNRMAKDRETAKKRAESGILGGNPKFKKGQPNPYYQKDNQIDKQKDNHGDYQKITPSSSSSSSDQEKENTAQPSSGKSFRDISPVLYSAMGIETPSIQEEGKAFEAWQELKAMGATVEDFAGRAARYREKWPEVAFTFRAVLKNWSQFAPPKPKPGPLVPFVEYLPDSLLSEATDG